MTEKSILFTTDEVKATLEGRKTQTRRVIKPQPEKGPDGIWDWRINGKWQGAINPKTGDFNMKCPYGAPGDILWVRETWCTTKDVPGWEEYRYGNGNPVLPGEYFYKAGSKNPDPAGKWHPSTNMPREAARLFPLVKAVRVERLQDISEEDARAEGVKDPYEYQEPEYYEQPHIRELEINKSAFAGFWDYINAKRGYGWDVNPWVFVIEFERVTPEGVLIP